MRRLHNLPALKVRRRSLRALLTPAEAVLWKHLQSRQLEGRKFRRQHSIGRYILDFYCPEARLAVELDGAAHDSARADANGRMREEFLRSLGIKVLRYENRDVMANLEAVLLHIRGHFN